MFFQILAPPAHPVTRHPVELKPRWLCTVQGLPLSASTMVAVDNGLWLCTRHCGCAQCTAPVSL
eukprot:1152789-Pelagomonas_calceolata.AAC.3